MVSEINVKRNKLTPPGTDPPLRLVFCLSFFLPSGICFPSLYTNVNSLADLRLTKVAT